MIQSNYFFIKLFFIIEKIIKFSLQIISSSFYKKPQKILKTIIIIIIKINNKIVLIKFKYNIIIIILSILINFNIYINIMNIIILKNLILLLQINLIALQVQEILGLINIDNIELENQDKNLMTSSSSLSNTITTINHDKLLKLVPDVQLNLINSKISSNNNNNNNNLISITETTTTTPTTATTTAATTTTETTSTTQILIKNNENKDFNETRIYYINPSTTSITNFENKCHMVNFNETIKLDDVHCNTAWDSYLCWPLTPANSIAKQNCPNMIGMIIENYAERKCDNNGKWMNNPDLLASHNSNANGWTNFTKCYKEELLILVNKCHLGGNCAEKLEIAERTRILEIIGLMLSFFTLLISLLIFFNFQSLRNSRTKIHKNLFIAMEVQVIIRLIIYFDQKITRSNGVNTTSGIENTPYVCEFLYFLLEYARTAMFMWMLIEGIYLHSGVTWITGTRNFPYIAYAIVGWGTPLIMTAIWEYVTVKYHTGEKCLFNYNLTPYYMILEGPRHTIILLNLIFLLNIIRVLVVKLRQSHSSDLDQVRKAVRAAIVLLPLLGIAHILFYFEPTDRSVLIFAIWSYSAHFLRAFQGYFIALIYCFMNGEVRTAVTRGFRVYMSSGNRTNWIRRRTSVFSGAYNTTPDTEGQTDNTINRTGLSPKSKNGNCSRQQSNPNKCWIFSLCFRGQVLEEQPTSAAPESVVFELSEH